MRITSSKFYRTVKSETGTTEKPEKGSLRQRSMSTYRLNSVLGIVIITIVQMMSSQADGASVTIPVQTPQGTVNVSVEVSHAGERDTLVTPATHGPPDFSPPAIQAVPLPSGSGARAIAFSGAFTAVADDATAASWNPAGLIQLERPEASAVLRLTFDEHGHASSDSSFDVGKDDFNGLGLNYASAVVPVWLFGRNFVFSINHQEAYVFDQEYHADLANSSSGPEERADSDSYTKTVTERVVDGIVEVDITSRLTTKLTSVISQLLTTEMMTEMTFDQDGAISALTPAMAIEVTPRFSLGAAVNVYSDMNVGSGDIRSRTVAAYSGTALSSADIRDERVTSGSYTFTGVAHLPPSGIIPVAIDVPISGEGEYSDIREAEQRTDEFEVAFDGVYTEENEYRSLSGINATLGLLWTASRHLSLGAVVELPWTADAEQTRVTRRTITAYDQARTSIIDTSDVQDAVRKDIEFDFPMTWSAGAVWRWTDCLYTTVDIGQTMWSDFAFQADGEDKINPIDGSVHGINPVDDCWSVRFGAEYLLVLMHTAIPFRAGASWEERPAIGSPDEYLGFSLGTGISLGQEPGSMVIDIAYMYTHGEDVLRTLVAEQDGLSTDVTKQQCYVSCIWHF